MTGLEKGVTGLIAVGLVTAFGLHAAQLGSLFGAVGGATVNLERTALKG